MSLKFSHRTLIFLAGATWLCIGIMLLFMGIRFIMTTLYHPTVTFSLIDTFSKVTNGREQGAMLVMAAALMVGMLKGRTVLAKSAKRQMSRICSYASPTSLKHLYSPAYYILIVCMIGLGISLKFLPISLDTRGAVDMAIGSALINGALYYFRFKEKATA